MPDTDDELPRALPADKPPVLGYQAQRSGGTARVATCADAGEGQALVAELSGYGIPAAVINEHTSALGPWAGNAVVKVEVPLEDADRASEIINRLRSGEDLEPEEEPPDGSVSYTTDEHGQRQSLAAVGSFDTAREMYDCAATLGSVGVAPHLPNLVLKGDRPDGSPPRRFVVRVLEEDLSRARRVLGEAQTEAEESDEPRCPACGSWHIGKRVEGLLATVARWLGARPAATAPSGQWQCYRCRKTF
jgi:hypothetical protein